MTVRVPSALEEAKYTAVFGSGTGVGGFLH